jgi:hypothetical protein
MTAPRTPWGRTLLLLLTLVPAVPAADNEAEPPSDPDEPPLVGRPDDLPFSGACGHFRVRAQATPRTVRARETVTFTLTVEAVRPVKRPPRRLDLSQVEGFAERFFIEGGEGDDERHPDAGTWEFVYRLRPRDEQVKAVPGVPFLYFDPELPRLNRQPDVRFQVPWTDPIPLEVRERENFPVPLAGPDVLFRMDPAAALLAQQEPWTPPGVGVLLLLLFGPPLLCGGGYLVWRRLRPDAAREARQRRSRLVRTILDALHAAVAKPPREQAEASAQALTGYLRQRLELTSAEPTPDEVVRQLRRAGVSRPLARRAGDFCRACDAARFGGTGGAGLAAEAAALVQAVEAEIWPSGRS